MWVCFCRDDCRKLRQHLWFNAEIEEPLQTIRELLGAAESYSENREAIEAEKAEKARVQRLTELAKQEDLLWQNVYRLIEQKKSKPYGEAVRTLKQLKEVSQFLGEMAKFDVKMKQIQTTYRRLFGASIAIGACETCLDRRALIFDDTGRLTRPTYPTHSIVLLLN